MCGIIGYISNNDKNNKKIAQVLIDGLKKLEYRGYDSAGICVKEKENLITIKEKGRIQELEKQINSDSFFGNIGIAHTRWATHGEPSKVNAHPHMDCKSEIAVVHNGIIENYNSLKDLLEKEGHKFISQTDSEVIVHLVEKFYLGNLEEAVFRALKLIEGAFGLAIIGKKEEKIIVAKRGSPVVIGLGDKEKIAASDIIPILSYTNKIIYLNDDEVAIMEKNNFSVKNLNGKEINKKIHEIKLQVEQIEKGGFKHFMLKEINEQPKAIENTLKGRIRNGAIKLSVNIDFKKINRIVIVACGTSWHSALIGKYLLEKISGIPVEVDYASEFRYRNPIIKETDLIIAISQSGETADTLAALKEAKKKEVKTLGIINIVGSIISREVDSVIYLHAGPEIGVASTKAFTCQVVAILLLALFIKQEKEEPIDIELLKDLQALSSKVRETLNCAEEIKKIAEKFKDSRNLLYLGRGLNFPVALEGALKLKEISYIHAEGYPAAEMKHGPIALIDENMPVVFLATKDSAFEKIVSNMEEVKTRGGNIIAIANEDDEKLRNIAKEIINIPSCREELGPIINVLPLQLLAYYIADLKGINVDKPRNLAKSVTVE